MFDKIYYTLYNRSLRRSMIYNNIGWTGLSPHILLNSLLSFFSICISCHAKISIMSGHHTTDKFVFSYMTDRIVVAFCDPWSGVEFRPVNLLELVKALHL